MPRSHLALVALALSYLAAPPAHAGPADPRFSSVDPVLVGTRSDGKLFHVALRNVNNGPQTFRPVAFDFSGTSVRLDAAQASGITVDCAARTVTMLTDNNGNVDLRLGFGGFSNGAVIPVSAGGVILALIRARSTDFDSNGATDVTDLGLMAPLYLGHSEGHSEADFDGSGGAIDLADLTIFAREYLLGHPGTRCP